MNQYTLLFGPESYDEYRKVFSGVEKYEGQDMKFSSLKGDPIYSEVKSIVKEKEADKERLTKIKSEIKNLVLDVLNKYNVKLNGEYEESLLGAELLDIGSTGRGTNVVGEGGLGGVGVENLILAYEGNIKKAFGEFYKVAINPDGTIKTLEELKKDFKILDAGMNLRFNGHDNFVYNMNEDGYTKMIGVIKKYIKV